MAKSLKKISRIFLLVLLVVVTICFAGCSEVQAMTVTNEDGTIDELVYVTLDATAITEAGYSSDEIDALKNDIQTTSLQYAQAYVNDFKNSIRDEITQTTDTDTRDFYMSLYVDGISVLTSSWENDIFSVGLRFKNEYAYNYFYYGTIKVESSEGTTESHFFYDKVSYTGYTKYVVYSNLYTQLTAYFTNKYPDLVNVGESSMLYTYITESSRLKSDADYVTYLNGSYYHTWVVDSIDEQITIYYIIANRAHWILVCIGVGLVVAMLILATAIIVNRRKKHDADTPRDETPTTISHPD